MNFVYEVTLTVNHQTGKFADRDSIAELIQEELNGCGPDGSGIGPDGDSEYEISVDDVSEVDADGKRISAAEWRALARKVKNLEAAARAAGALTIAYRSDAGTPKMRARALDRLSAALVKAGIFAAPKMPRLAQRRTGSAPDPRPEAERHERRVAAPSERRQERA
jgi:hypothetical protein